jgi:cytochrome c oxidase cbb3-type subunit III
MKRAMLVLFALFSLAACKREERRFEEAAPMSADPEGAEAKAMRASATLPAPGRANPYENNAWAAGEGERLYRWFNCVGCHAHGGGGMGPPLMDAHWRYGADPTSVFTSIVQGRPNGMPAFGPHITEQQAWELVLYVRSLSGNARLDVRPGRSDEMHVRTPPSQQDRQKPEGPR